LRELLGNLIHNAIEHAGAGSRITVRTRGELTRSVLEVVDDGRGLPADELPQVWDRFRRGAGAGGLGTGLGLAIVRDIARLHGGDAVLRPGAEGRGLTATVTLPRSHAEPVANLS